MKKEKKDKTIGEVIELISKGKLDEFTTGEKIALFILVFPVILICIANPVGLLICAVGIFILSLSLKR